MYQPEYRVLPKSKTYIYINNTYYVLERLASPDVQQIHTMGPTPTVSQHYRDTSAQEFSVMNIGGK